MAITATNTNNRHNHLIYYRNNPFGKKLHAFLEALNKDMLIIDVAQTMPSDTQWHDIAKELNVSLKAFIDIQKVDAFNEDSNYSEEDLVKILAQNPSALKGAILMEGDRIAHITQYTEILKFYNVDSAGLEKTLHTQKPITSSKTKGDNFI